MSSFAPVIHKTVGRIAVRAAVRTLAMLIVAAAVIAACGCEGPRNRNADVPDPAWSTLIAAHTNGPVSRKSAIRIVFARDVVAASEVGKPMTKFLESEPAILGRMIFESTRELALQPSGDLQAGQNYRIKLHARGLQGVPEKLDDYIFLVQVQAPQFDIRFEGLTMRIGRDDEMALRGEVVGHRG